MVGNTRTRVLQERDDGCIWLHLPGEEAQAEAGCGGCVQVLRPPCEAGRGTRVGSAAVQPAAPSVLRTQQIRCVPVTLTSPTGESQHRAWQVCGLLAGKDLPSSTAASGVQPGLSGDRTPNAGTSGDRAARVSLTHAPQGGCVCHPTEGTGDTRRHSGSSDASSCSGASLLFHVQGLLGCCSYQPAVGENA